MDKRWRCDGQASGKKSTKRTTGEEDKRQNSKEKAITDYISGMAKWRLLKNGKKFNINGWREILANKH